MKIKTNELTRAALDQTVAKIEIDRRLAAGEYVKPWVRKAILAGEDVPSYSGDWLFGGEIIERERIELRPMVSYGNGERRWWIAGIKGHNVDGDTPLAAAMRCYVARKLGDEVEIPKELA